MDDRLRFHPLVVSDLHNAVDWYDGISPGLGNRFRGVVDDRLDAIAERPEAFPTAFEDTRFARLVRFPYLILFRIYKDVVHVFGIFHGASDPEKWRQRLD